MGIWWKTMLRFGGSEGTCSERRKFSEEVAVDIRAVGDRLKVFHGRTKECLRG